MITLDTTTLSLEVILGAPVSLNQLHCYVAYSDDSNTDYVAASKRTLTNNAIGVTICAAPAAGIIRDVSLVNIYNADNAAASVIVRLNDNGTLYDCYNVVIQPGATLTYVHGAGWNSVGGIVAVTRSYLAGLTMSTAGASTTMTVASGAAADSTNAVMMLVASAISKTTSAWVVGTAQGGLDTGIIANSTWYHFYEIRRPDTGVVDVVFSLNATAPTLPANYTQYRRVGSGVTNGSSQWVSFIQTGDLFEWVVSRTDSTTVPGAATLRTLSVPTGVICQAKISVLVQGVGGGVYTANHWNPALGSALPGTGNGYVQITEGLVGTINLGESNILVNTNIAAQIYNSGTGMSAYSLYTEGWIDSRGRNT